MQYFNSDQLLKSQITNVAVFAAITLAAKGPGQIRTLLVTQPKPSRTRTIRAFKFTSGDSSDDNRAGRRDIPDDKLAGNSDTGDSHNANDHAHRDPNAGTPDHGDNKAGLPERLPGQQQPRLPVQQR